MNRDEAYLLILQSAAVFQQQISMMLEGQALAAQKSRDWICNHMSAQAFVSHVDQSKQSAEVHEQLIETIGGITKMEAALGRYLEVLIGSKEDAGAGMGGFAFPGMFGAMGGGAKDEDS